LPSSVTARRNEADRAALPALTRNGYTRLPEAEADIRSLLALPDAARLAAFADAAEGESGFRSSEALVFFIRLAHRCGEVRARDALVSVLIDRCKRYLRTAVRGVDTEGRLDVQNEVFLDLARLLLARDDSADFLESRFLTYLKRETARARGVLRKRHHRAPLIGDIIGDEGDEEVFIASSRLEQSLAQADAVAVREAIGQLPEPLRELIVLRYYEGWQIGDERRATPGEGEITLARKFDVTPRTIHNWLARAYAQVASYWKDDQ
jgi:DNA-directed RNA polymerase specialized sigma24 family protein